MRFIVADSKGSEPQHAVQGGSWVPKLVTNHVLEGLFPGCRPAKRVNGCIRVRFLGTFRANRAQIHRLSRSECRTIAKPIKTESTIQSIETEKFCYILSLGFFEISVASLERVTFPGQKVLNMG
jgi:hypothetical protein